MGSNEYELIETLSEYEKNFYKFLKGIGVDVQINDGNTIDDRFNIPEADMPKVYALVEFFKYLKNRK